jgi:hypothetical protein
MDVHVPAAVTAGLRRERVDVLTAQEDGSRQAPDDELLSRATALGRLIYSQDRDLLRVAHRFQTTGQAFAGLAYAPQGGISIGRCTEDLALIARCCEPDEVANQVVFLPLT